MNRLRILVLISWLLFPLARTSTAQDDLSGELSRVPPREPPAARESFRILSGFTVEPVAVEPTVVDPVSACFDADGRLYVVEMRGYPYPEDRPSGRVRRLEDRDADGRFESATVFLDGLSWPTGVVPYKGGVFVAAAPDILYARDDDGDGVADVRTTMFTGFGTDNVQGLLNGLLWGPDGWIYGVTSSNGGEIKNLANPDHPPVSVRGRDFRFRPDGSAFEAVSGGGQFGHAFDDWGHRFTCSNSNHIRQIVLPAWALERNPAFVPPGTVADIAVEGPAAPVFRISAAEPWRLIRTRQRAADPEMRRRLPPSELVPVGFFTSATGITIYRGSAYPPSFQGNAFIGDVGGNLVHRKSLAVQGGAYVASRADRDVEFLASDDNWFRPVNFANTPHGTLLILDMYRETIEHPWSIPEPIKKHLDLTSGHERGRLYEVVYEPGRRIRQPRLNAAASSELVGHLADPDAWWRETAQRLLMERRDLTVVPRLRSLMRERPTALGRLHALWTLSLLDRPTAAELILVMNDPEPRVREQAVLLARSQVAADPSLLDAVIQRAEDPDPMVRFQAALVLGEAGDHRRALEALATIAAAGRDDPWTRAAVMSSVSGRASAILQQLVRRPEFLDSETGRTWLNELALLVGAERNPSQIRDLLGRLRDLRVPNGPLIRMLLAVGRGLNRVNETLAAGLSELDPAEVEGLLTEAGRIAESELPIEDRLAAIGLLGLAGGERALAVLPSLLDARQPPQVQLGVLQALAGLSDPSVGTQVVRQWKAMSPTVRREAVEVLFGRADRLEHLLEAIEEKRLAVSEIDPARLDQLRAHSEPRLRARAIAVLGSVGEGQREHDRQQALAAAQPALALEGNPERGRTLYDRLCATCHRAEGRGVEVGPDLATVAQRSPADLLVHIIDPNREVAPNFMNYIVATSDGRSLSGIIVSESAGAITLKRAEGATDVVPRSQIEEIVSSSLSLMPEGLEKGLTPSELADLIAFVRSIRPGTGATTTATTEPVR